METMEQTGCDLILFGQKSPISLVPQGLEGSTAVVNDEIGNLNLAQQLYGNPLSRKE